MVLLILLAIAHAAIKDHVIYAINCGSTQAFIDGYGIEYAKDIFYAGGKSSDFGEQYEYSWDAIPDKELFLTERYSNEDLTYKIPLKHGKYVLNLKFSEVYFEQANMKIFDVKIGSDTIIHNLDIYARVGRFNALEEFFEIEINEDGVKHQNKLLSNAYASGELIITLAKGSKDNPKINGIVIFEGGMENTYYEEKQRYLEKKKDYEKERKKSEKYKAIGVAEESTISKLEIMGPQSAIKGKFVDTPVEDALKENIRAFLGVNWALESACYGFTVLIFCLVIMRW